jgi:hypothetical protein
MGCLKRRAKKYGIEVNETEELPVEKRDAVIDWYLKEMGMQ